MSTAILKFLHPCTIMVAGPSESGKTWFVKRVIREKMIVPPPRRIMWIFKEHGDKVEIESLKKEFPQVEFHSEIPTGIMGMISGDERNLVILDDVMKEASKSDDVAEMFTQGCHHRNMTVMFLVQNVFYQGKESRTISLNTHYMVLYKNPRDKTQVRVLAHQMFPEFPRFLIQAFEDATEKPHTYLLIDLHPLTPETYRIRTRIFPDEQLRVYNKLGR